MRKIIGVALLVMLSAVGCSSDSEEAPAAEQPQATVSTPAFDREAEQYEAWRSAADVYPAKLKLSICDAAEEGGAAAIGAVLTDEEQMPFVVDDPEYDAQQWAKYCAGER